MCVNNDSGEVGHGKSQLKTEEKDFGDQKNGGKKKGVVT